MANKKYDKEEGVWRTIGGRRVFIRTGQSLSQAMKESGKFKKKEEQLNQEELNNLKHPKGLKTYDSVEDRYNKDKDFRNMLKKIDDDYNDDKLMSRKEYESYASRIRNREDYASTSYEDYIEATKNVGSIKEVNDSIKTYDGYMSGKEGLEEYNKVDKEWQDLAKKMEKDYDEYGGNTVEDMKRLNELSRKRDYLSIYNYNEENKKLFDKYDKEEISHKEYNEKSDKLKEKYLSAHENVNLPAYKNTEVQKEVAFSTAKAFGSKEVTVGGQKYVMNKNGEYELEKTPYNSKAYAKLLSQSYNADSEYEDKITPKYIQDIDAGRYGNMSDEEAIKNWIDGGADIIYNDDAERQLKEWGIPVRNDDAYGTYKSELAKQLAPIYRSDKRKATLTKLPLGDLREIARDYNLDTKNLSRNELIEKLLSIFKK